MATVDANRLGDDLDALAGSRPLLLPLPLIEKDEFQSVKVRDQDQHVIEVAFAEHAHEVVAYLGGERLRLGEDNAEELFWVFGKEFNSFDGVGRFACQSHRLRGQDGSVGGVVPKLREEG